MPVARFQMPDGRVARFEVPEGTTPEQAQTMMAQHFAAPQPPAEKPGGFGQALGNLAAGAVRGAGSIGATLLTPYDLIAGNTKSIGNQERRQAMDDALQSLGAQTDSPAYGGGKLAGEIAGTAGMGGVLANGLARVVPRAAPIVEAIGTAGMKAGGMNGAGGLAARSIGGGVTGTASAALVNPEDALIGGAAGAAMPGGLQLAGKIGAGAARTLRGSGVAPEVAALASRAQQLGINIPADRIANSKPLNALAASLNYVPLSGRAATEAQMGKQLDTALSRTFGQNSDNVTQALRTASGDLGAQFDQVLKSNTVKITPKFQGALAQAQAQAENELGTEGASIIKRQIAQILEKGSSGEIDGQAAYNIKKTLDRIGSRPAPEAYYARDLKGALMDALNESMGPQKAGEFAKLRQQYGNMLTIEKIAQNGAEGGVSIGRLANMKNIGNKDVQELADIAAQFLKTRENPHGAMQRTFIGGTASLLGGVPYMAAGMTAGRAANSLLNSNAARKAVLGQGGGLLGQFPTNDLTRLGLLSAPILASDL